MVICPLLSEGLERCAHSVLGVLQVLIYIRVTCEAHGFNGQLELRSKAHLESSYSVAHLVDLLSARAVRVSRRRTL